MANYTCTQQTEKAQHAIRAAKHVKQWGPYAAKRYAEKRGVSLRLFMLAFCLEYRLM